MRWVRWALAGCGALGWLLPSPARAAEAPATYALSWVRAEGAEDCASGHVLAAEVEQRLGRAVFDATAERSIEVEVTRFGERYRSDVYVRDASGHAIGHRSLESDEPSCGALVNATALAIALVIDPDALARPQGPVVTAEAPVAPPPPPPLVAPPALAAPPAPAPVAASPPAAPASPPAPLPTPVTVSLRALVAAGVVAATSPGVELAFSGRPNARWGFELGGAYLASQTVSGGGGSLDVGLTRLSGLVTLDAARSERARLSLGLGPTLGAFHVAVRRPQPVSDSGDFWFAALSAAVGLQVSVTDGFFIELGAAGLVPLRRQAFEVRGQTDPVWRQPLLSGLGFLGVGARFP